MKKVSDHFSIRTRFIFIVVLSKFSLQNKEKVQCMCHCICEGYELALDPSWQTQPLDTPPPFPNG